MLFFSFRDRSREKKILHTLQFAAAYTHQICTGPKMINSSHSDSVSFLYVRIFYVFQQCFDVVVFSQFSARLFCFRSALTLILLIKLNFFLCLLFSVVDCSRILFNFFVYMYILFLSLRVGHLLWSWSVSIQIHL